MNDAETEMMERRYRPYRDETETRRSRLETFTAVEMFEPYGTRN